MANPRTARESQIVATYKRTRSVKAAAEKLGVSYQRVHEVLTRLEVIKPKKRFDWDNMEGIIDVWLPRDVASVFNVSRNAVYCARARRK